MGLFFRQFENSSHLWLPSLPTKEPPHTPAEFCLVISPGSDEPSLFNMTVFHTIFFFFFSCSNLQHLPPFHNISVIWLLIALERGSIWKTVNLSFQLKLPTHHTYPSKFWFPPHWNTHSLTHVPVPGLASQYWVPTPLSHSGASLNLVLLSCIVNFPSFSIQKYLPSEKDVLFN